MHRLVWIAAFLVGCAADPDDLPEPPSLDGKSDTANVLACSFAHPKIASIKRRAAPVDPVELAGMRPIDGIPLPSVGQDPDGFFHPNRVVIRSDDLAVETDTAGDYIDALGFDSSSFRA